jgi:pyruvate kinase
MAAAGLAESIGAVAIVGFTSSGTTVARLSRKRPSLPILAITPDLQVARRIALMWGAHSVHSHDAPLLRGIVTIAEATVRIDGFDRNGDLAIVAAGIPFGQSGRTNNLRVIRIAA